MLVDISPSLKEAQIWRASTELGDREISLATFLKREYFDSPNMSVESIGSFAREYFFEKSGEPRYLVTIGDRFDLHAGATMVIGPYPPTRQDACQLLLLATRSDLRGRGIGSALLENCRNLAISSAARSMVAVWPKDEDARRFWVKNGFSDVPFPTFGGDMWQAITMPKTARLTNLVHWHRRLCPL